MAVRLGPVLAACEIAFSAKEQAQGLQRHAPLMEHEGMLFPMLIPRAATFHMGTVSFPIDIVFADASSKVGRIVTAEPGSLARWSFPATSAVIEVAAGFCRRVGVTVGDRVAVPQTYNLLRTITEAEMREEPPALMDGYYSKEPLQTPPRIPREKTVDRFRDRRLPDESFSEAMDQPEPDWKQQVGYDPTWRPFSEGEGPALRPAAQRVVDPALFVPAVIEAAARANGIEFLPDVLTGGRTEHAVITSGDVRRWLGGLGIEEDKAHVATAASSADGLRLIGDGLILAGLADMTKVVPADDGYAIVAWRGRKNG